jgi:hypothetical protein
MYKSSVHPQTHHVLSSLTLIPHPPPPSPPLAIRNGRDGLNLDQKVARQPADLDRGARGLGIRQQRAVHLVDGGVVVHRGEEDGRLQHVRPAGAGFGEDRGDVGDDLFLPGDMCMSTGYLGWEEKGVEEGRLTVWASMPPSMMEPLKEGTVPAV